MGRRDETNRNERAWRLDQRDHALLLALLEHKVLTTDQVRILLFCSSRRCQHRLKELKDLGLIGSFSPRRNFGQGRPPDCLFLTKLGLSACAKAKGVRASDLSWIPDDGYRDSQNLAHRLGVNAFFCGLIEASRTHQGHCLAMWRPEHWVRTRSADVKPDGFGRYLHPGGACQFYLEYDRGTEAFGALSTKLEGYLRLAGGWTSEGDLTGFPNLLLVGPEGVREGEVGRALRHAIQRLHIRAPLAASFPLYVASEDRLSKCGVLAPVWTHSTTDGDRVSLLDLPAQPIDLYRTARCLGRYYHRCRPIAPDRSRLYSSALLRAAARAATLRRGGVDEAGTTGETSSSYATQGRGRDQSSEPLSDSRAADEPQAVASEDDGSLRPLARALLALAEQLREA